MYLSTKLGPWNIEMIRICVPVCQGLWAGCRETKQESEFSVPSATSG